MSTLLGTLAGVKSVRFWQLSSCWWILRWWLLWRPFPDCAQLQKHAPKTRNKQKIIPCSLGQTRRSHLEVWCGFSMRAKETFLPVFKDQRRDQGCNDHDERHSDCDYLVNCQTCKRHTHTHVCQKKRWVNHKKKWLNSALPSFFSVLNNPSPHSTAE